MITIITGTDSEALIAAAARCEETARKAVSILDRPWPGPHLWPERGSDLTPLHPSLHGAVADEDIARSRRQHVVAVTHSEVYILRVRRRVAEGKIDAKDVDLVWIGSDGSEHHTVLNRFGQTDWAPESAAVAETAALISAAAACTRGRRSERTGA